MNLRQSKKRLNEITDILLEYELHFTIVHNSKQKVILITCAIDCDSAKVAIPDFRIKLDPNQKRYAELVISYN